MTVDELPNTPGVYLLTHRVTRDTYVGKALELRGRVKAHICAARSGRHESRAMNLLCQRAGADFDVTILQETSPEDRREAELRWIKELRPTLNAYNTGERRPTRRDDKPPAPKKFPIGGAVTAEVLAGLKAISVRDERAMAWLVARAVEEYVERHHGKPLPPRKAK